MDLKQPPAKKTKRNIRKSSGGAGRGKSGLERRHLILSGSLSLLLIILIAYTLLGGEKNQPAAPANATAENATAVESPAPAETPATEPAHILSAEEAALAERVRKIPATDYKTNMELYQRLMELDPDNAHYREKYAFYSTKYNDTSYAKADEETLFQEVLKVPEEDYETNMRLYKELMELNPDKALYRERYELYAKRYEEAGGGSHEP